MSTDNLDNSAKDSNTFSKDYFLSIGLGIVLILLVLYFTLNASELDNLVLLEKRNPGFYALSQGTFYQCIQKQTRNLMLVTAKSQTINGVSFTVNADGSINVNGMNNGDNIYYVIGKVENIPNGTYYLSDGGVSTDNIALYSEKDQISDKEGNLRQVQAWLPGTASFIVDNNKFDTNTFAIFVPSGTIIENVTFYPMLSSKDEPFQPCWIEGNDGENVKYDVTIDSSLPVNANDKRYLKHFLNSHEFNGDYVEITRKGKDFYQNYKVVNWESF